MLRHFPGMFGAAAPALCCPTRAAETLTRPSERFGRSKHIEPFSSFLKLDLIKHQE